MISCSSESLSNLSRKITETSDEVFKELPSSPEDDLEEVDTLKEMEHETDEIATSVESLDAPLDAIVAFEDDAELELSRLLDTVGIQRREGASCR